VRPQIFVTFCQIEKKLVSKNKNTIFTAKLQHSKRQIQTNNNNNYKEKSTAMFCPPNLKGGTGEN